MAKLTKIQMKEFGPYRFLGKAIRTKIEPYHPGFPSEYPSIPQLWQQCFNDDTFSLLCDLSDYCPLDTPDGYQGLICDYNPQDQTFTYIVGFIMNHDTPILPGYTAFDLPKTIIAEAIVSGSEQDILSNGYNLCVQSIEEHGYRIDYQNYFICEMYTEKRYGKLKRKGKTELALDCYLPVVK